MDRFYDLWEFSEAEQAEFLGTDIGLAIPTIVVELDERSLRRFYNRRFAPLSIDQTEQQFTIAVRSIDDSSLRMIWEIKKMAVPPHEARKQLAAWLKRTNYFINLRGIEDFCKIFGDCEVDYN